MLTTRRCHRWALPSGHVAAENKYEYEYERALAREWQRRLHRETIDLELSGIRKRKKVSRRDGMLPKKREEVARDLGRQLNLQQMSKNAVMTISRVAATCFLLATSVATTALTAADYSGAPLKEEPPAEIAEPLRKTLRGSGFRVKKGDDSYVDLWFVRQLKTQKPPAGQGIDFGHIAEGSLVAVMRWHGKNKDFRNTRFKPGVYTLRKLTQPEDGDHLGVTDTRDFLVVCPPKEDKSPAPLPPKKTLELSLGASKSKHPLSLYLMKLFDEPKGAAPRLVEDSEQEFWIVDCHLPGDGASGPPTKRPIRLGVVVVGQSPE